MIFTSRIDETIKLAAHLHRNQTRHDENRSPYISHLVAVAMLISEVTTDEDVIIAGLMHDSLEDVPDYDYDQLVKDCGERVATIVRHVTEPLDANKESDEQLPWMERKEAYLYVLKEGGTESAIVSAADKIHNTESYIKGVQKEGDKYTNSFGSSVANRLQFHERVLALVTEKLGEEHALIRRFNAATVQLRELVEQLG